MAMQPYVSCLMELSKRNRCDFHSELESFLQYVGKEKVDMYWQANKDHLLIDRREKRHITVPAPAPASAPVAPLVPVAPIHKIKPTPKPIPTISIKARPMPKSIARPMPKSIPTVSTPRPVSSNWCASASELDVVQTTTSRRPVSDATVIADPNTIKEEQQRLARARDRDARLYGQLGLGWDLVAGKKRQAKDSEVVMTVFSNGKVVKTQEPDGLPFLLPRGMTLAYYKGHIQIVSPEEAEEADDAQPDVVFYTDAPGCKRSYKFLYSMRTCIPLYTHIGSL